MESHLLQMRGLKHECKYDQNPEPFVASFTDAWIETGYIGYLTKEIVIESHLLQMRGLKQEAHLNRNQQKKVASFTDAWIETETWSRTANLDAVASFTDAWIET